MAFRRNWRSFEWTATADQPQHCSIEIECECEAVPCPVEIKVADNDVGYAVSTRTARGLPWTLLRDGPLQDGVLKLNLVSGFVRVEFESDLQFVDISCCALGPRREQQRPPPAYTYRPSCVWSPDSQAPLCGDNALEKRSKERRSKRPRRRVVGLMRRAQKYDLLDQVRDLEMEQEECH